MKYVLLFFIILLPWLFSYRANAIKNQNSIKLDTVSAVFLYEINVPELCYQKNDELMQGHNLILYDKSINKNSVQSLYNNGIYYLGYSDLVTKFEQMNSLSLPQNKRSIYTLLDSIIYYKQIKLKHNRSILHDKSGLLFYKRIFAKVVVADLGSHLQLIPNLRNYKCCFSNIEKKVKAKFIVDVLYFKTY